MRSTFDRFFALENWAADVWFMDILYIDFFLHLNTQFLDILYKDFMQTDILLHAIILQIHFFLMGMAFSIMNIYVLRAGALV